MKQSIGFLCLIITLAACASNAFEDHTGLILDVPNKNMRAHDPKLDRPISDCDPEKLPSGALVYKCIAHFLPDYDALINKINDLESQLAALQRQCPK